MKNLKTLIGAILLAVSTMSFGAHAEDCEWTTGFFSVKGPNVADMVYFCEVNDDVKATKTVGTASHGEPTCSITTVSGYTNKGSCIWPDIAKNPPKPQVCPVINIGMTCDGSWHCAEAFGRTCFSRGGKTVWENGQMVCRQKSC